MIPPSPTTSDALAHGGMRRSIPLEFEAACGEEQEQDRADVYALLARLLLAAPDARLLHMLASLARPADPLPKAALEQALEPLCGAAAAMPADLVAEEFAALFEGTGSPLIDPYASLYTAGYMMEKPLAALRADLRAFGLARRAGAAEPEDHLGALFETMRLLIAGAPGFPARAVEEQRRFFDRHIAPWAERCLDDIANAGPAVFYRHVAGLGVAFLAVEAAAFELT